jgi:drug/metabolite transporter (DMT)-like permease
MTSNSANSSPDNVKLAISAIIFAVFSLSLGDAIIKSISVSFPLWQLYVLRSVIAIPLLLIFIKWRHSSLNLIPKAIGWVLLRSFFMAAMLATYYIALPHLQLSVAAAAYNTLPLFIILLSAVVLKQKIQPIGWFAIGLGFVGVLFLLRPTIEGFNLYALLPLFGAVLHASAMLLTRTKCKSENPLVLTLFINYMFIAIGVTITLSLLALNLPQDIVGVNEFLLGGWVKIGTLEIIALVILATTILVGNIFGAIGYQIASPHIVAPFDYFYLIFSVLWGVLFFSEFPNMTTVIGMVLITSAGLITIRQKS